MLLFASGLPTLETLLRHRRVEPPSWASAGKESRFPSDIRVGSAFSIIFITKSNKSSKQVELTERGKMILWTPCLLWPFWGLAQWERRYFRCTGWQQQALDCILLNEAGGVPWRYKLLQPVLDGTSSSLLCRRLQKRPLVECASGHRGSVMRGTQKSENPEILPSSRLASPEQAADGIRIWCQSIAKVEPFPISGSTLCDISRNIACTLRKFKSKLIDQYNKSSLKNTHQEFVHGSEPLKCGTLSH